MEIPIGKKMTLGGPPPSDDDTVRGDAWIASRTKDGFLLTWDAGGLVYTELGAVISETQFSLLRRHPEEFNALARDLDQAGLTRVAPTQTSGSSSRPSPQPPLPTHLREDS